MVFAPEVQDTVFDDFGDGSLSFSFDFDEGVCCLRVFFVILLTYNSSSKEQGVPKIARVPHALVAGGHAVQEDGQHPIKPAEVWGPRGRNCLCVSTPSTYVTFARTDA